jgi:hypothetical protein
MAFTPKLAVAVAATGLALAVPAAAQAAGGNVSGSTSEGCAYASGNYQYFKTGEAAGEPLFRTQWDIEVQDWCTHDGVKVGLYTKYWKWSGGAWIDHNKYEPIGGVGKGDKVRDVKIYVCQIDVRCAQLR